MLLNMLVGTLRNGSYPSVVFLGFAPGMYKIKIIFSLLSYTFPFSLFGAMFPLPRIVYAMASDSLVFKFLGRVHSRFQTPVIGTLLAGLLTGTSLIMIHRFFIEFLKFFMRNGRNKK